METRRDLPEERKPESTMAGGQTGATLALGVGGDSCGQRGPGGQLNSQGVGGALVMDRRRALQGPLLPWSKMLPKDSCEQLPGLTQTSQL